MKSMQVSAIMACMCAAALLSGCYSPDRFRSESADILVAWGNPKYHIFFEQAELASGTNEYTYEFANPPRMEFELHLIFLSREDEERLKARNAQLAVEVADADGLTAYAREWAIHDLRNPIGPLCVRPPDGWCSGPKGNVVRETQMWTRDLERSNGRDVWVGAVPDMGLVSVDSMKLGSKDYRLRITITLDEADEPPMHFHVSLSAGWYATTPPWMWFTTSKNRCTASPATSDGASSPLRVE